MDDNGQWEEKLPRKECMMPRKCAVIVCGQGEEDRIIQVMRRQYRHWAAELYSVFVAVSL